MERGKRGVGGGSALDEHSLRKLHPGQAASSWREPDLVPHPCSGAGCEQSVGEAAWLKHDDGFWNVAAGALGLLSIMQPALGKNR